MIPIIKLISSSKLLLMMLQEEPLINNNKDMQGFDSEIHLHCKFIKNQLNKHY